MRFWGKKRRYRVTSLLTSRKTASTWCCGLEKAAGNQYTGMIAETSCEAKKRGLILDTKKEKKHNFFIAELLKKQSDVLWVEVCMCLAPKPFALLQTSKRRLF